MNTTESLLGQESGSSVPCWLIACMLWLGMVVLDRDWMHQSSRCLRLFRFLFSCRLSQLKMVSCICCLFLFFVSAYFYVSVVGIWTISNDIKVGEAGACGLLRGELVSHVLALDAMTAGAGIRLFT